MIHCGNSQGLLMWIKGTSLTCHCSYEIYNVPFNGDFFWTSDPCTSEGESDSDLESSHPSDDKGEKLPLS